MGDLFNLLKVYQKQKILKPYAYCIMYIYVHFQLSTENTLLRAVRIGLFKLKDLCICIIQITNIAKKNAPLEKSNIVLFCNIRIHINEKLSILKKNQIY